MRLILTGVTRLGITGALLVTLFSCGDDETSRVATLPDRRLAVVSAELSMQQRQETRRFWVTYRQATARRIDGDYAAALAFFDSALALQPSHLDALYYSGNAAFELSRFAEAEARWRRELAANEHSARAHAQIGLLYSCGLPGAPVDLARAVMELQAAHGLNRAETGPLVRLGEVSLLQGDLQAARTWLNAAAQTNIRSTAAVYLLGYLDWVQEDTRGAQALLRRAVGLAGGGPAEVSASAEGQTRRGHRPLLESGRIRVLARFWQQLASSDESVDVDIEYTAFNHALVRLRRQLAGATVGD